MRTIRRSYDSTMGFHLLVKSSLYIESPPPPPPPPPPIVFLLFFRGCLPTMITLYKVLCWPGLSTRCSRYYTPYYHLYDIISYHQISLIANLR